MNSGTIIRLILVSNITCILLSGFTCFDPILTHFFPFCGFAFICSDVSRLEPKRLATKLGTENEESCTTYNMLKVSISVLSFLFKLYLHVADDKTLWTMTPY